MALKITFVYSGEEHRIKFDGEVFIPIKVRTVQDPKSKNFGKEAESDLGFYKTLSGAVKRLVSDKIASSDDDITLAEFVERYEAAVKEIRDAVDFDF